MRILRLILALAFFILLPLSFAIDSDKDGTDDSADKYPFDFDNDGMPDDWEIRNGLRYDIVDSNYDNDNDGLSNVEEYILGTDPNSADSDGDSVNDYNEKQDGTDPLKKDRIAWALVIVPIIIILFVVGLFFFEKYHLDVILKEKFGKYFVKKEKDAAEKKKASYEQPRIELKSVAQMQKEKEVQKQKFIGAFGNVQQSKRVPARSETLKKESVVIKQEAKEKSNKDVFERLKGIR
jgi:hypothetical protein